MNFDHLNPSGVMNSLNNATRPYVEVMQIALVETREVKATWLGRIVHRMRAEKMYMTVTAFRGSLFSSTLPTQEENGRTPSRATAKMRREAATITVEVPWTGKGESDVERKDQRKGCTKTKPITAIRVMKMLGPLPNARA